MRACEESKAVPLQLLDDTDLRNAITKTSEYVSELPKERKVADPAAKGGLK